MGLEYAGRSRMNGTARLYPKKNNYLKVDELCSPMTQRWDGNLGPYRDKMPRILAQGGL